VPKLGEGALRRPPQFGFQASDVHFDLLRASDQLLDIRQTDNGALEDRMERDTVGASDRNGSKLERANGDTRGAGISFRLGRNERQLLPVNRNVPSAHAYWPLVGPLNFVEMARGRRLANEDEPHAGGYTSVSFVIVEARWEDNILAAHPNPPRYLLVTNRADDDVCRLGV
jgi:hypothetical protein